MAFDGQPVLSTEYQIPQAKVSDGQSVVVTATGNVVAGEFYEIEGFLGAAMTNGKEGDKVVLNIEQAEYQTTKVASDKTFTVGHIVYWNGEEFTPDATKTDTTPNTPNRVAGRCTSWANNVLTFILAPQAYSVVQIIVEVSEVTDTGA